MSFEGFMPKGSPLALNKDNGTASSLTQLPTSLLETFIPGYGLISQFFSEVLGFDVTIIVSLCLLVFAVGHSAKYLWQHVYYIFSTWFMSSITIASDDDMFDYVMKWLAEQDVSKKSRDLIAATQSPRSWDLIDGELNEEIPDAAEPDPDQWLNYSDADSKLPPRFEPNFGEHWFRHGNRFLFLSRTNKSTFSNGWAGTTMTDKELVTLSCIGRSTEPIKQLFEGG